jgi:hypothetical protein
MALRNLIRYGETLHRGHAPSYQERCSIWMYRSAIDLEAQYVRLLCRKDDEPLSRFHMRTITVGVYVSI